LRKQGRRPNCAPAQAGAHAGAANSPLRRHFVCGMPDARPRGHAAGPHTVSRLRSHNSLLHICPSANALAAPPKGMPATGMSRLLPAASSRCTGCHRLSAFAAQTPAGATGPSPHGQTARFDRKWR
jgi:hypothetical protein